MSRAAVLVLLAACGDGLALPDAAVVPPDSDFGLVRVQYKGGIPGGNVVMFQNADGSTVLVTRTDADGEANAYMRAGGSTTIIGTNGNTHLMYTWTGVQPGDELVLDRRRFSDVPFDKAYLVTMPIAPGADTYQLLTACGGFFVPPSDFDPNVVVDLRRCTERTDMLVLTNPPAYLHAAEVPLDGSGIINLSGGYQAFAPSAINVSGGPTTSTFAFVTQFLIAQGQALYASSTHGIAVPSGFGQVVHDMPLPAASTLLTNVEFSGPNSVGSLVTTTWGPAKGATPIDVSTTQLRAFTSRPVYDPNQQRVTWTEAPVGALGDAVLLQVGWFRPGVDENFQWQVLARRGPEPMVQLPQLPGRDFIPHAGDTILPPALLVTIGLEGGFDRLRTRLLGSWVPGDIWPIDTAAGSVVYEMAL